MPKKNESIYLAKKISEFLFEYAPNFLTESQNTLDGYNDAMTLYITFLEENDITSRNFTHHHFEKQWIEKWIMWLKNERGNGPSTLNNRLGQIRKFLEFLGDSDIALSYLYSESKLIKRQKEPKKKVTGMSREAVAAILKAPDVSNKTDRRDLTFMTILYGTAARIGEVLSIKIKDVHLDTRKPFISIIGKGGKARTLYLLPRAAAIVKRYIEEFHRTDPDPDQYLFYSRVGGNNKRLSEEAVAKRIRDHGKAARMTCTEVPKKVHAHLFRHARASHWLEEGISIFEIQFLLGHENIETTMKYLDITTTDMIKALATLENEHEKKLPKKWKHNSKSLLNFCGLNSNNTK